MENRINNVWNSRLQLLLAGAAVIATFLLSSAAPEVPAETVTQALSPGVTRLAEGNARFVSGEMLYPNHDHKRIMETSKGQNPFAAILSCADSRVPVELVFDQGVGDLFVVRVAGNVCEENEIGSLEFAVKHLGTNLIVVLGHSACGAVGAVCRHTETTGSIPVLLDSIGPAVDRVREQTGKDGDEILEASVEENVRQSMQDLLANSPFVRNGVQDGSIELQGGVYDLASGKVRWISGPTMPQTRP